MLLCVDITYLRQSRVGICERHRCQSRSSQDETESKILDPATSELSYPTTIPVIVVVMRTGFEDTIVMFRQDNCRGQEMTRFSQMR